MQHSPKLFLCVLPPVLLIALLSLNIYIFGDNALSGANQFVLILVSAATVLLSILSGTKWDVLKEGIVRSLSVATPAILILLMVGALSGTWLLGGIVPAMIYYGLYVLDPSIFLFASCVISAVVSVSTGSSWTTSATIGIALMGIGSALGFNPAMVAGAIISGAYFGDKLSPLSDTTNLASGVANVDLFTHIRYMLYTTVPSLSIALLVFIVIGLGDHEGGGSTLDIQQTIAATFNVNFLLLLAPVTVIFMIIKKIPALPALFVGAIVGAVMAVIFQNDVISTLSADGNYAHFSHYAVILNSFFGDTILQTGSPELDELLSSGGMAGMLNTIWLIICAMIFGGTMEASGFLQRITSEVLKGVRNTAQLFSATVGTCLFTNLSASDQYLAIVVPGQMYGNAFKERGLAPQNLSRSLEDAGTATSVLIPWNTCGAFHASVLGVATLSYLPFAVFCYLSPLMTLLLGFTGFRIARVHQDRTKQASIAVP